MTDIEYVTACYACAQGLVSECLDPQGQPDGTIIPCIIRFASAERSRDAGGGALSPKDVTDAKSTGRKRAILVAPILEGMLCEWAGLRQAGGGVIPIVGCAGNQLSAEKSGNADLGYLPGHLHHGPDKNTLNNAPGTNLHRLCAVCHNRWHAANNEFYSGERPEAHEQYLPELPYYLHDANTEATGDEQEAAELWWDTSKPKRGAYPVSPKGLRKIAP